MESISLGSLNDPAMKNQVTIAFIYDSRDRSIIEQVTLAAALVKVFWHHANEWSDNLL